jgi:hypothetical protein
VFCEFHEFVLLFHVTQSCIFLILSISVIQTFSNISFIKSFFLEISFCILSSPNIFINSLLLNDSIALFSLCKIVSAIFQSGDFTCTVLFSKFISYETFFNHSNLLESCIFQLLLFHLEIVQILSSTSSKSELFIEYFSPSFHHLLLLFLSSLSHCLKLFSVLISHEFSASTNFVEAHNSLNVLAITFL